MKRFSFVAVSSGDILRRNIREGTEIGRIAREVISKGGMVPDDIMVKLINAELAKLPAKHWLFDGFPRSVQQARCLDTALDRRAQPLNLVINLDVPTEIILSRIIDRWVHVPSGRVYNSSYNPPRVPGHDDVTGEKLTRRPDDDPGILKVRMEKHHALTQPLLEHYEKKDVLVTVAGNTSDEIYPQIEAEIAKRLFADTLSVPG